MPLRFIYVVLCINSSFLFLAEWYFIVLMYNGLSIHCSGVYGLFLFLAKKGVAVNICGQILFRTLSFHFSRVNTQKWDCCMIGKCMSIFVRNWETFRVAISFCIPTSSLFEMQLLFILASAWYCQH